MFAVFKKRTFSDLMNDTITFFKEEGKPFFKNYFALCGVLLLFLFVSLYFLTDVFFESMISANNSTYIDQFIDNNFGLIILLVIIATVISLVIGIISTAYPIYYLKNMVNIPDDYHNVSHIRKEMRQDMGRLIKFTILSIFVITPIVLIAFAISFVLIFVLIGIPLLIILSPAIKALTSLASFEYITNKKSFFESYNIAYYMVKDKFWLIIGNTIIVSMVIQTVLTILIMIPYMIFIFSMLVSEKSSVELEETQGFKIIISVVIILSTLGSVIANNVILINQGLIYYSIREQQEGVQSNTDIDTIGSN